MVTASVTLTAGLHSVQRAADQLLLQSSMMLIDLHRSTTQQIYIICYRMHN
jgi:hypothetical protein